MQWRFFDTSKQIIATLNMLETSTITLLLVMVGFIAVAMVMSHHHGSRETIRRKKGEVEAFSDKLNQKIGIIEQELVDLKLKVEELDEEIETYQQKVGQ